MIRNVRIRRWPEPVPVRLTSGFPAAMLLAAGPYVAHLRRRARSAAFSEYHPEVAPGTTWQGVRCEDVQALT